MNYYIADYHLFHKNVTMSGVNFDDRPYEDIYQMHEDILNRWNKKITNGDTVYILGDMSMRGRKEDLPAFVSRLKGHKILIQGNHDDVTDYRYQKVYDEICEYKEIRDRLDGKTEHVILCHYPILMWKNQHRGAIHLYGHVHMTAEYWYYIKCLRALKKESFQDNIRGNAKIRAYNVGCMLPYMDYEPRTLEEIVTGAEAYEESLFKDE